MENKNVVVLKHHPKDVKLTNAWYKTQVPDNLGDYIVVDVTSRVVRNKSFMQEHVGFNKDVSPFFLGPVVNRDGTVAHVFEHYWQASKVFPCHYDEDKNEIKKEYWDWRAEWFGKTKVTDKRASRRPHSLLGYKDSECLFSLWYDGHTYKALTYVEARKKMYIPEYAKLIVKTKSFNWLKKQYEEGKKIALVDFDGYNYYYDQAKEKLYKSYVNKCKKNDIEPEKSLEDFLGLDSMSKVIDSGFTPAGHGFIIKMLLEGDIEVIDNNVIDNIGVLNIEGEDNNLPFELKGGNYNELSC